MNPNTGDGFCTWCKQEMRYTPAELSRLRADGELFAAQEPAA